MTCNFSLNKFYDLRGGRFVILSSKKAKYKSVINVYCSHGAIPHWFQPNEKIIKHQPLLVSGTYPTCLDMSYACAMSKVPQTEASPE